MQDDLCEKAISRDSNYLHCSFTNIYLYILCAKTGGLQDNNNYNYLPPLLIALIFDADYFLQFYEQEPKYKLYSLFSSAAQQLESNLHRSLLTGGQILQLILIILMVANKLYNLFYGYLSFANVFIGYYFQQAILGFAYPFSDNIIQLVLCLRRQPLQFMQNNLTDSEDSEQQQNFIYQFLPQARPLHTKSIIQPISLFPILSEPVQIKNIELEPQQLLESIPEDRNKSQHAIGSSLAQIFKEKVYQSYQQLQLGNDNYRFGMCMIKIQKESLSVQALQPYENVIPDDGSIIFQSRFQSGNLAAVSRSSSNPQQYFLALQRDTNSLATCQWYYFYVENRNTIGTITFNIVNLVKNYSAYENGMKPCVYSLNQGKEGGCWKRDGFNIMYKRNSISYKEKQGRNYYTFQFSYNFTTKNDRVYFAYSYPYTFSRLQNFLSEVQAQYSQYINVKTLSKSLLGNSINIISITNSHKSYKVQQQSKRIQETASKICYSSHQHSKKDLIFITARVHPGQTNSSFACESLIEYLVQNSEQANNLRKNYIIKIIPFLNPDGVILGNYRTSFSGHDLNRRWKKQDKDLHPEIYAIKKYLSETHYSKMLYIDLHGHSKKKSSFMYGCLNRQIPYLCKQFPFILSKYGYEFCYFNCNFSTPAARQGTSRLCMWKQFGVDYSYTMEISFCGPIKSKLHFRVGDYMKMGRQLGKVMSLYFCGKKEKTNRNEQVSIPQKNESGYNNELKQLLKELYIEQNLMNQGLEQTSGSQSGQQDTELQLLEERKEQKGNRQNSKQIKGLLNKYLNESKIKWPKQEMSKQFTRVHVYNKKQQQQREKELRSQNLRSRKQYPQSRINIQNIDLTEQATSSYSYRSGSNMKGSSKQLISKQLYRYDTKQTLKEHKKVVNRITSLNNYRPYSYSKSKLHGRLTYYQNEYHKSRQSGRDKELSSLILPKVLKQEEDKITNTNINLNKYKKYVKNYRYKVNSNFEYKFDKTNGVFAGERDWQREIEISSNSARIMDSRAGNYSHREISLAEKMLKVSQKQFQESCRYWNKYMQK